MRGSDYQREENYNEFLRLQQNNDYIDVTYDEPSGGVSAVHKLHKFAKKQGINGMRQGDYELVVLDVLRKSGHRVILEGESNTPGVKTFDGYYDDIPMEIKAIEGKGIWAISTKLRYAERQHAKCVVLYFPKDDLYSEERIIDGLGKYMANPDQPKELNICKLITICSGRVLKTWYKKTTPIEGWSIQEGFRRENGANSYTLSPSNAKV